MERSCYSKGILPKVDKADVKRNAIVMLMNKCGEMRNSEGEERYCEDGRECNQTEPTGFPRHQGCFDFPLR